MTNDPSSGTATGNGWRERENRKLSLRELARRLKITPPYLSDMELGRRKYSIEWVRKAFSAMEQNGRDEGRAGNA